MPTPVCFIICCRTVFPVSLTRESAPRELVCTPDGQGTCLPLDVSLFAKLALLAISEELYSEAKTGNGGSPLYMAEVFKGQQSD